MNLRSLKNRVFSRPAVKLSEIKTEQKTKPIFQTTQQTTKSRFSLNFLLNKKGTLTADVQNGGEVLSPLLNKTLCNKSLHYQAVANSQDGKNHVLLDTHGRLISLGEYPQGFVGITHSQQRPEWKAAMIKKSAMFGNSLPMPAPSLSVEGNEFVNLSRKKIPLPDNTLIDFLTDSPTSSSGSYRLHMKRLHKFDPQTGEWVLQEGEKKSLLLRQPTDEVWVVTKDKTLAKADENGSDYQSDLSSLISEFRVGNDSAKRSGQKPISFDRKIEHYSLSKDNQAIVQLNNDEDKIQRLVWIEDVQRPDERVNLTLPTGYSCRKTAMIDKTVFAIDYRGRVQACPLPSVNDPVLRFNSSLANVRAQKMMDEIEKTLGPDFKVEDIGNVKDDKLHLVVRDAKERKHFIGVSITRDDARVMSSWNLTDSMTLDNQKGLLPFIPETKNVIDLDRLGKVTVYDNRPYFLNEQTGQWELTSEEKSERLKLQRLRCGLDGKPWMLKDGNVKRLKVRETTNKQSQSNAVFVLPQTKKSLSIDTAAGGMDNQHNLIDFAAADVSNIITLNKTGDLNFHTTGSNRVLKSAALAKAANLPDLKIKEIAFTKEKQLLLLSDQGYLLCLSESQWTSGNVIPLRIMTLPVDERGDVKPIAHLHTTGPGNLLCEIEGGELLEHTGREWLALDPELEKPITEERYSEMFNGLKRDDHVTRIPGTGTTLKTHWQFGGMDKQKTFRTRFRDRMDAFIFRPTMAWPRPLKNAAYGIQHSYAGREGLKEIYQMQSELSQQIRLLQTEESGTMPPPVMNRIKDLVRDNASDEEKKLIDDIGDLATLIENSSNHYSKVIGKHYGLLDKNLNQRNRPKMKRTQSGMMNFASSRTTDLTRHLQNTFKNWAVSEANPTADLFTQLVDKKVVLNQQKENVPLGMNRDQYDDIGLVKSRVILDALTLKTLHDIISDLETRLSNGEDRDETVHQISEQVNALRYGVWERNPIKTATDQGFENHNSLEAGYDSIRSMVKAFSKSNHGVNVTTRSVMNAKDQDELEKSLVQTLKTMETGEILTFARNYGVNASVSSYFDRGLFLAGSAKGSVGRGYQMSLQRIDGGFNVSFGRALTTAGNVQMGFVENFAGEWDNEHQTFIDGDDHYPVSKTLLFGGGVSLSGREVNGKTLSLDVTDREISAFIAQLVSGELNPIEMMNRGNNHQLSTMKSRDFDLSLSAQASAYITMPYISDEVEDVTFIGRARLAGQASVSLASGRRERTETVSSNGSGETRTDNRVSMLDRATVGGGLTTPIGPRFFTTNSHDNVTAYVSPSIDFNASIDNRTNHKLKVDMMDAEEISTSHIDAITARLEKHFPDNTSAELIVALQKKDPNGQQITPPEKLHILDRHFAQWYEPDATNPETRFDELVGHGQKSALLALQTLVRQQQAYENRRQIIAKAEYQTSYKNLGRLNHNSFIHYISNFTEMGPTNSNADRLKTMMKDDHQLGDFIKSMQQNAHAVASVTLEFNTATRNAIEKEWANGTLKQEQIMNMLKDKKNVRLKSVSFTQTVKKSDGYASPSFILGGSNGATVAMTEQLGTVNFSYGDDNDHTPVSYTLRGRIATSENQITAAMDAARQSGLVLRPTA